MRLNYLKCLPFAAIMLSLSFFVACGSGDDDDDDTADDDIADADDDDNASDDDVADDDDDDMGDDDGCGMACSDDDDDVELFEGEYTIPEYPFFENDAIEVSDDALMEAAFHYCNTVGDADAVDFFLGYLPINALDTACAGAGEAEQLMGSLYLSGYFGGVWLRDKLDGVEAGLADDETDWGLLKPLFKTLAKLTANRLEDADAPDAEAITAAKDGLNALLLLYGYNRGYLEQIIDVPPPGLSSPEGLLECADAHVLDCAIATSHAMPNAAAYDDANDALASPVGAKWQEMEELLEIAENAIGSGEGVWESISIDKLDAAGYDVLLDLSAGYLRTGQAASFAGMTAYAQDDADAARCSILMNAGVTLWSGAYFMGLASPADPGTFPTFECVPLAL